MQFRERGPDPAGAIELYRALLEEDGSDDVAVLQDTLGGEEIVRFVPRERLLREDQTGGQCYVDEERECEEEKRQVLG